MDAASALVTDLSTCNEQQLSSCEYCSLPRTMQVLAKIENGIAELKLNR
jgi:hypothetical protein